MTGFMVDPHQWLNPIQIYDFLLNDLTIHPDLRLSKNISFALQ